MLTRIVRFMIVFALTLALGLVGGSAALAHGHRSHGKGSNHRHGHKSNRGDNEARGDHGGSRGDCGDKESSDDQGEHGTGGDCGPNGYSAWDEEWLKMSIEGDLFEIACGQIAQQKGTIPHVRDLGARLVQDHSKSLEDATKVANDLGIDVPTEPSPSQQWELRVVQTFSGSEFDRWYSDLEVQDHKQDIQEAQDEVDKGCNDQIKALAEDDLPTLQEHLSLAQAALQAAGGPAQTSSRSKRLRHHMRHHARRHHVRRHHSRKR